ncbi:unnamed protein product, partial [Rotaria sp. Silwood2]
MKPSLIFMAFEMCGATPSEDQLVRNGLLQPSLSAFFACGCLTKLPSTTFIEGRSLPMYQSAYKKICGSNESFAAIVNGNHMNFNNAYTELTGLTSIVGKKKQVYNLIPNTPITKWVDKNGVLRILDGEFNPYPKSIGDIR